MRWQNINSELLLLVFLPGLAFNDSISQDVHLFHVAIFQIFNFAFPLVLAGKEKRRRRRRQRQSHHHCFATTPIRYTAALHCGDMTVTISPLLRLLPPSTFFFYYLKFLQEPFSRHLWPTTFSHTVGPSFFH